MTGEKEGDDEEFLKGEKKLNHVKASRGPTEAITKQEE